VGSKGQTRQQATRLGKQRERVWDESGVMREAGLGGSDAQSNHMQAQQTGE
jgi:hypothetical protein